VVVGEALSSRYVLDVGRHGDFSAALGFFGERKEEHLMMTYVTSV
jgi:hypothetical protein